MKAGSSNEELAMIKLTGRFGPWVDRHFMAVSSTLLILFLLAPYLAPHIFYTIPAGHGGALWLRFFGGTVVRFHFGEGLKAIFPWDKIYIYDLRLQQKTETYNVLTRDNLQIQVEGTTRFRLLPGSLGTITAYAGPDYVENLMMPSVGAVIRLEAARYSMDDVYSTNRRGVEEDVLLALRAMVQDLIPMHAGAEIDILDFRIRSVVLPEALQHAIQNKLTQLQLSEGYKYILSREEQEKQRKIIEAEGIKAFQDIVSSGISENYLRWKGIDATLKLADSPNSKIVIIGGKEGLPVILGPLDGANATAAPLKQPVATPPLAPSASLPSSATNGSSDTTPSSVTSGALPAVPTEAAASPRR
jgi:regulator of protease activity HflC (stomatin/prohibitin superfamily)